ncbi:MAG: type II toxin-antitoxin system RelE/ParE family toxin [Fimbriimonadaceae bacterium]|nr:type II toxin-antitoxin system RelE/ParE family toxin [Fimbriimonadaceae bacterium]
MAREEKQRLTVEITDLAEQSLAAIWRYNAEEWGEAHADHYLTFLRSETENLGRTWRSARPVPGFPTFRFSLLKTRRSKGHGHLAVFEIDGDTLRILDFHHTAQDWQSRYGEADS